MGTCGVMWLSPESQLWDHTAWANGFVPQTVNHDEEVLYPRLCFSDLCYCGRSQTQVNFLLMKNPLLPSAFDHILVISSLRLEPPLLWASLLSESIQPNRKPLFSTGNPTLVFNKGFFFFVIFTLDSLPSKERLPCLIHFFTDAINRNGGFRAAVHLSTFPSFLQLKVENMFLICDVEEGLDSFLHEKKTLPTPC